jgi:diphosphomevalonate decarboxylase
MNKITVRVSSDVALLKYWGVRNAELRLPANTNLSMVLDALYTTTTVEFLPSLLEDEILIDDQKREREIDRVKMHLDRIRRIAQEKGIIHQPIFAKVVSENNFPKSTGLSSSASAFAALSVAATKALGLELSQKELSILSRFASGSSCRCVCGGFVEWKSAENSDDSYAETIFPRHQLEICDLITIVSTSEKKLSSTEGHQLALSSPFFATRLQRIDDKLMQMKRAIKNKEFQLLGELVEAEALEFHSILLTSQPPQLLLEPGTVSVMQQVQKLRQRGIPVYFTVNTGFNIHVLTLPEFTQQVLSSVKNLKEVQKVILSSVGDGPKFLKKHLF